MFCCFNSPLLFPRTVCSGTLLMYIACIILSLQRYRGWRRNECVTHHQTAIHKHRCYFYINYNYNYILLHNNSSVLLLRHPSSIPLILFYWGGGPFLVVIVVCITFVQSSHLIPIILN